VKFSLAFVRKEIFLGEDVEVEGERDGGKVGSENCFPNLNIFPTLTNKFLSRVFCCMFLWRMQVWELLAGMVEGEEVRRASSPRDCFTLIIVSIHDY
jgi:hypothetical protein